MLQKYILKLLKYIEPARVGEIFCWVTNVSDLNLLVERKNVDSEAFLHVYNRKVFTRSQRCFRPKQQLGKESHTADIA